MRVHSTLLALHFIFPSSLLFIDTTITTISYVIYMDSTQVMASRLPSIVLFVSIVTFPLLLFAVTATTALAATATATALVVTATATTALAVSVTATSSCCCCR